MKQILQSGKKKNKHPCFDLFNSETRYTVESLRRAYLSVCRAKW